jgi:excisionase family DNA binding protein
MAHHTIRPKSEWVSLQDAAAAYDISVLTLRRRIAAGVLPATRLGGRVIRVRRQDVAALFRPIPTAGKAKRGADRG